MAGGVGKVADRGRAGKFKKPTRGGGKHFSRDLQPVDADGNQISMWAAGADEDENDEEEEDDEESSEDEESEEGATPAQEDASREARKALKKARKEAAVAKQKAKSVEVGDMPSSDEESEEEDEDMPANPNHSKAARKMAKQVVNADEDGVESVTEGLAKVKASTPANRKEKESMDAAAAKEKYMKLHAAGKTDEAKSDLARLKLIREQREAEAARRAAEKEEKEALEKTRKQEIEAREAKKRDAAAGPKKTPKKK